MKKFNFYNDYWKGLDVLNPFQLKKVLKALSEYAENETIPKNLSQKGMTIFNQIQRVILEERFQEEQKELYAKYGKKGAKIRWNG